MDTPPHKHWATWLFETLAAVGAITQVVICVILVYQLRAYVKSNELTQESLDLNKKYFDISAKNTELTQKNVELAQRSLESGQKNIELSQKALELTQKSVEASQKANTLTEQNILAANTPFIDGALKRIFYDNNNTGDNVIRIKQALASIPGLKDDSIINVGIDFVLQNRTTAPADKVFYECFLEDTTGYADKGDFVDHPMAIAPQQIVNVQAHLIVITTNAKAFMEQIKSGKVGILLYVYYNDPSKKRKGFLQHCYVNDGQIVVNAMEYNPSDSKINKLLKDGLYSKKH